LISHHKLQIWKKANRFRPDRKYPDLFSSIPPYSVPTSLTTENLESVVLASAPVYSSTVSSLQSIKDMPIPPAELSTKLIDLQPRLSQINAKQETQWKQLSELRKRTAVLLENWYEVNVVAANECWAEWDQRLGAVERRVRQEEKRRERED
jgi:hypothetical protein